MDPRFIARLFLLWAIVATEAHALPLSLYPRVHGFPVRWHEFPPTYFTNLGHRRSRPSSSMRGIRMAESCHEEQFPRRRLDRREGWKRDIPDLPGLKPGHPTRRVFQRCRWHAEGQRNILFSQRLPLLEPHHHPLTL